MILQVQFLIFLTIFFFEITCEFKEKLGLYQNAQKKFIDSASYNQFGNILPDESQFDAVQYNVNGDWALIYYIMNQELINLTFYTYEGIEINTYNFSEGYFDFNEGDLGVSITATNKNDEIFIALTYENSQNNVDIVGGIIGIDGKFRQSNSWVTILSSVDFNYSRPQVLQIQNYLYVVAFKNNKFDPDARKQTDFEGTESDDHFFSPRRNLNIPELQVKDGLGQVVFNFIYNSGNSHLKPPLDLEGTLIEFYDLEQTQRVYMNSKTRLKMRSLVNSKAVVIFEDTFSIQAKIVYFIIDDAIPQIPKIVDNSKTTFPDEYEFQKTYTSINIDLIPNTENICITYSSRDSGNSEQIFITTINTSSNETICHKSYSDSDYFLGYVDFLNGSNPLKPSLIVQDQEIAYLSFISNSSLQGKKQAFIIQVDPNTCILNENFLPFSVLSNNESSSGFQKMKFLQKKSQNKYQILHIGPQSEYSYIVQTLIELKSMYNCNQKDETNNICTSCQPGFGLTDDGQCIRPNCAMDCTSFGQICNLDNLQCFDCYYSNHCENNSNGSICIDNICQNKCISKDDCVFLGQKCNLQTQQCEEIVISELAKKIEQPVPDQIPLVEQNNGLDNMELEFEILDQENEDYELEFLKLSMDGIDMRPVKVDIQDKTVKVSLPKKKGQQGRKETRLHVIQGISGRGRGTRILQEQVNQQIYVDKTFQIVDSVENYLKQQEEELLQVEIALEQYVDQQDVNQDQTGDQTGSENQEQVDDGNNENQQYSVKNISDSDNENDKNIIIYYVLIPLMFVGFIGFTCLGFILGKKSILNKQKRKVFSKVIEIQQTTETLQTEQDEQQT